MKPEPRTPFPFGRDTLSPKNALVGPRLPRRSTRGASTTSIVTAALLTAGGAFATNNEGVPSDKGKYVQLPDALSREWQPPTSTARELTLEEAVRLTIANDPTLRLVETDRDFALGLLQEAQGRFDLTVTGSISGSYDQDTLTESQLEPLREQRDELRDEIEVGTFQSQLLGASRDLVGQLQGNPDLNGLSPTQLALLDPDFVTNLGLLNILIAGTNDAALRQQFEQQRNSAINAELDILGAEISDLDQDTADAAESLDLLGDVPDTDESWSGNLRLGLSKEFRNGLLITPELDFNGEGTNFKGKPNDRERGGKGIPDLYTARAGFSLSAPLLRNRGRVSTGAAERSAEIAFEASEATLRNQAALSVLRTAAAYWELVAAEERLALSEVSLERQRRLSDLSRGLIEADELPAAEAPRIDARLANARSSVQAARNAVQVAGIELARAIGEELTSADEAPRAADDFPDAAPGMDGRPPAALIDNALAQRRDLGAARLSLDAADVQLAAANRDLSAVLDFSSSLDFGNAVEDSASDLFDDGWVGPSASAGLDYLRPLANNAPRGFYRQQEALVAQNQITSRNLERLVRAGIAEAWQSLIDTRAQIEFALSAVASYNQTVSDEFERFRLGSSTLIDAILTEQRTTDAMFSLIAARQRYALLLAQLRFESASLVGYDGEISSLRRNALVSLPELGR